MKRQILLFALVLLAGGVFAQKAKADLSVYPNPAVEYINVQDNNDAVAQVLVFNILGKKVKEFEWDKDSDLYVADLPKGMYLVQLLGRNKAIIKTQKIDKR